MKKTLSLASRSLSEQSESKCNGMEREDEIAGVGNMYTAKFWEYDIRTARRWNQDPRPNSSISSYGTFALNPVMNSDVMGDTITGKYTAGSYEGGDEDIQGRLRGLRIIQKNK